MSAVIFEASLTVPADVVWAHLREPEKIACWFGWEYEGLAEEIEQIFGGADVEEGRAISWEGGDRFELEPRGERTRLRVLRELRPGYDAIAEGWITFANQLAFAVERHLGEDRRTVYLSGPATDVGLGGVGDRGEPYVATVGPGDVASGLVWFRSEHQVGATVDEYGGGLLIVTEHPTDGSGTVVLSTYAGLDVLEEVGETWRAWWAQAGGA